MQLSIPKINKLVPLAFISLLCCFQSFAQESLSQLLNKHNSKSIPYITVQELAMPKTKAIILDARELTEYNVSHIKNAIYVGYSDFDIERVTKHIPDLTSKIVVYCSLGIRSEDIAEHIKKAGYTNVYNLYGGIFEWKNNNLSVFDSVEQPTEDVHTCSKEWSPWLLNGIKIHD